MKQTLLLISCMVFVTVLHAQSPTLTSIINYGIGDKQITLTADTAGVIPGPAGISQTWDFSKLTQDSAKDSSFTNYVDPSKTQFNKAFPAANVAGESSVQGGVSYTYYDLTNSAVEELGNAVYNTASMTSNIVKYVNPLTQMTFPIQYGYTHKGTYNAPPFGNAAGYTIGTYVVKADAYGSMKIRNTQYDSVLRLYVINYGADSIYAPGIGSFEIPDSTDSYIYYCPGKKSPILTISYSPYPYYKRVTFNDFDHVRLAGLASEKNENISFSLFPNPAKNTAQVLLISDQPSKAYLNIVNELGQVVKTVDNMPLVQGTNNFNLDLQGIPPGIYFVNLISNGQVGRQKLVVE